MSIAAKIGIPLALAAAGSQLLVDSPPPLAETVVSIPSAAGIEPVETSPAPIFYQEIPQDALSSGPIGLYLPAAVAEWRQY